MCVCVESVATVELDDIKGGTKEREQVGRRKKQTTCGSFAQLLLKVGADAFVLPLVRYIFLLRCTF